MFIGRERELASLKEFYDKDGIGMTVIYDADALESLRLLLNLSKIKKQFFIQLQKLEKPEISNCFQDR